MRDWTARWIAWSVGVTSIALLVGALVFKYLNRAATLPEITDSWRFSSVLDGLANMGPSIIGVIIVPRRRENPIGWLFLAAGLALGLAGFSRDYALHALIADPGSLPFGRASGWLSNAVGPIAIVLLPFGFLLFPTGTLPSPRWRPVAWLSAAVAILLTGSVIVIASTNWSRPFANMMGGGGTSAARTALVFLYIGFVALPVAVLLSFIAAAFRFAQRTGDERLQLKWVVTAAAFVAITLAFNLFTTSVAASLAFNVAMLFLYAAIAIAILKYRLYDIDVIISKTVVYGGLAAFISAVYVIIVVVIGAFVGATEGLALVATAIVAIAFQPARVRAQGIANRLVYGKRATPYEVLSEFAERIGETYASEDILPRMARILAEGTGASSAVVWVRADGQIHRAAAWPDDQEPPMRMQLVRGELPPFDGTTVAVPVRHQGDLLGVLTLTKPPKEPLSPAERKLVLDLAAQAGLVLRNFRLIEDLRASRQRLVAAQDEERRRLERNLHDGAQQQLVALSVKQRLAESLIERDPDQARRMMTEIQTATTEALETLRDLARGIYPPLLADQGLEAALRAQIRRATMPIELDAEPIGRYPRETEAAVYFSCLEALQNVAKYASASRAVVRLGAADGWLRFAIADDGRGFDPDRVALGTGLQGIRDRLEALGGSLEIRSRTGEGTILSGQLPARALAPAGT